MRAWNSKLRGQRWEICNHPRAMRRGEERCGDGDEDVEPRCKPQVIANGVGDLDVCLSLNLVIGRQMFTVTDMFLRDESVLLTAVSDSLCHLILGVGSVEGWRVLLRVAMLMGLLALGVVAGKIKTANGTVPLSSRVKIRMMNNRGPYIAVIVPNSFEMNPLLRSPSFRADPNFPYLDILGRRFRFGKVENKKVVIVMTGLSMLNAGITTELLLALFNVKGVVHYGIAGNANPQLQIGDVTIPQYWAHTGLWNWQRFGDGPEHELAFESNGDDTREFGYLEFSDYNNVSQNGEGVGNFLNRVWYQREEVFPIDGVPEVRQHAFWVPVDQSYYGLSAKITDLKLGACVNSSTCLPRSPRVVRVERGVTANVFVDNKAYREFLRSKFNATPIDMESAGVALVCHQLDMPFIAFRSLSDLAGGGSSLSNEASTFASLAAQNAVDAMIKFISLLAS
ncbi:bark storage protein A-like [Syzygium oleosum]|uniref:bark storage protein A-like n=1 Tax=Syzygium oleosum TaxID=219896 RepID=UPI0024B8BBDB|nr:bark storage protein A-like [Syzygium oleosum]